MVILFWESETGMPNNGKSLKYSALGSTIQLVLPKYLSAARFPMFSAGKGVLRHIISHGCCRVGCATLCRCRFEYVKKETFSLLIINKIWCFIGLY